MTQVAKLVQQFADNVAAQTEAIRAGDPNTGNKHAKRYIQAFERLRALGDEGREGLAPLLTDSRADVRAMAAAFLLRHKHDQARQVLEELARGKGFVAFSAGESLKRWDEGTWELDPL